MRPPKPEALIEHEEWLAKGPPQFCWNCDHYGADGSCYHFCMVPPEEFTKTEGGCPSWEQLLPF